MYMVVQPTEVLLDAAFSDDDLYIDVVATRILWRAFLNLAKELPLPSCSFKEQARSRCFGGHASTSMATAL